jgi:hypothetical protein
MRSLLCTLGVLVSVASGAANHAHSGKGEEKATPALGTPRGFELHIDQDRHRGRTTPIAKLYLREVARAAKGDRLIILQKSLAQPELNRALVAAARRGVDVRGVYRDKLKPGCDEFSDTPDQAACRRIFQKSAHPHHKSMLVLRSNGAVRAIVGSYNTRKQKKNAKKPRTHTAIFFEVPSGQRLFAFYESEALRLLGRKTREWTQLSLPIPRGEMVLTMHPSNANPVLRLLNRVRSCEGNALRLSYFGAEADAAIGAPIIARLRKLRRQGCKVKFLLDKKKGNAGAFAALREAGVAARVPTFPSGKAILGHKLVLSRSGDDVQIIQSSANLSGSHHRKKHNLTLYLRGARFASLHEALRRELKRYWGSEAAEEVPSGEPDVREGDEEEEE